MTELPDPTGGLRRRVRLMSVVPPPVTEALPRRLRVGLLGGSFNPAHEGHLAISLEALKRLQLDQVWWLVSPQNPLKSTNDMAPLAERLASARSLARHPRIKVKALESRLGTRFTVDLLRRLAGWQDMRFVFLMGTDNLQQLPRWRHWRRILDSVGIAVVERPASCYSALHGAAASRLAPVRIAQEHAAELVYAAPPAWTLLRLRPHPASSTDIRRQRRQHHKD